MLSKLCGKRYYDTQGSGIMKLAQAVFFLFSACLLQSVSGDAPGDEHSLCLQDSSDNNKTVILLDSYHYINLLGGVFPPPVWKAVPYQHGDDGWIVDDTADTGGICKQRLRVCDYENEPGVNNWLYTQYIEYLDSKEVFVEVSYNLLECRNSHGCSVSYVTINRFTTNGSNPQQLTDSTNYNRYTGRFYRGRSTYTAKFERPTSDQKFGLAFRDTGTCGTISRVRVFYKVCASKVDGLTYYPSLPLPPQNSQEPNIAYAYCAYNSYNSLASGYKAHGNGQCEYGARCECRLGYEEVTTRTDSICRACPRGQYRSASDTACQVCPSNTVQTGRAVAECSCVNGFYRTANEGPNVACTAPPSACRNLVINSNASTHNEITVTWNRPTTTGRNDFYYNIYYSSSEDDGKFTQHNRQRYFMSSNTVSYTLTGLNPFTSYTIRVTVHNGVSHQDPAGKANRQCEVTTATIPNKVTQLDMLSGLAVWNSTDDGSTQYQIRYNRTEIDNHGNSDTDEPLTVYYSIIDDEANYTFEVRRWQNGLAQGYWSTPIKVQFKNSQQSSIISTPDCASTELFNYTTYSYTYFEDPCAAAIERIVIYHRSGYIRSIQVTYNLASGTTYTAPRRGRLTGTRAVINFEEGEQIISISGGWYNSPGLTQLKIITMKPNGEHRVYGPYGTYAIRGGQFVVNANVVSFFGRTSSTYVHGLGFKYLPNY